MGFVLLQLVTFKTKANLEKLIVMLPNKQLTPVDL